MEDAPVKVFHWIWGQITACQQHGQRIGYFPVHLVAAHISPVDLMEDFPIPDKKHTPRSRRRHLKYSVVQLSDSL
jgi:hypothetical protein